MPSFHTFLAYLRFLQRSKNEHGVHSPFVFNLLTKAIYINKLPKGIEKKFQEAKRSLVHDKSPIEVQDFGAGSKILGAKRTLRDIVKTAGISNKRARILFHIAHYLNPKNTLELGTSVGLSTTILALANPNAKIMTIEGCKQTHAIARTLFSKFELNNIEAVCQEFDKALDKLDSNQTFDLIYLDGHHQKEATLRYFKRLLDAVHNDSCLIIDDINWSLGMQQAWTEIQRHPRVSVSIDTFRWGIVFFRQEQQKEHFVLRV